MTDINALADEYLRLAYHGLKAKDKTFHATIYTEFDPSARKIPVVIQDMGRVFINLYNNAFYAVSEKNKQLLEGFEPTVSIRTKRIGDKLEIRIKDNGNGIPPKVIDKIFQPFFTTKPTGQGTGLGLSMSYDIEITVTDNGNGIPLNITNKIFQPFFTTKPTGEGTGLCLSLSYDIIKAHAGNLIVDSNEGEGAEFVIQIPVT